MMRNITVEALLLVFLFGDLLQTLLSALLGITLPPSFSTALVLLIGLESLARRQTTILLVSVFVLVIWLYALFIEVGSPGSILSTMRFFLFFTILTTMSTRGKLGRESMFRLPLVYLPLFLMAVSLIAGDRILSSAGLNNIYLARDIPFASDIAMGWETIFLGEPATRLWIGFLAADKAGWFAGFLLTILFSLIMREGGRIKIGAGFLIAISPILIIQLVLAKAAFLFFSLLFFCRALRSITGYSIGIVYSVGYVLIFISCVLVLSYVPDAQLSSSGAISHIHGLLRPLELLLDTDGTSKYFGFGPGLGGTLGEVGVDHSEMPKAIRGGESYIGALFFQYGLLGVPMILIGFVTILLTYLRRRVIQVFFLTSLPVLFFSEASSSFAAMAFGMLAVSQLYGLSRMPIHEKPPGAFGVGKIYSGKRERESRN